jgi:hypothetical protein
MLMAAAGNSGAGPTTLLSDSFTRANSAVSLGTADVGGTWTKNFATYGISSNKAYIASGLSNLSHNAAWLDPAVGDGTVSVDITLSATTDRACGGLMLRRTDESNIIRVILYKVSGLNRLEIQQMLTGGFTSLTHADSQGFVNGSTYTLKSVLSGTTVTASINGTQILSTTVAAGLTGTQFGPTVYFETANYDDGGTTFDNFLMTT